MPKRRRMFPCAFAVVNSGGHLDAVTEIDRNRRPKKSSRPRLLTAARGAAGQRDRAGTEILDAPCESSEAVATRPRTSWLFGVYGVSNSFIDFDTLF